MYCPEQAARVRDFPRLSVLVGGYDLTFLGGTPSPPLILAVRAFSLRFVGFGDVRLLPGGHSSDQTLHFAAFTMTRSGHRSSTCSAEPACVDSRLRNHELFPHKGAELLRLSHQLPRIAPRPLIFRHGVGSPAAPPDAISPAGCGSAPTEGAPSSTPILHDQCTLVYDSRRKRSDFHLRRDARDRIEEKR
jgi:hypothetical protein